MCDLTLIIFSFFRGNYDYQRFRETVKLLENQTLLDYMFCLFGCFCFLKSE